MSFIFRLVEILTLLFVHWIIAYRLTITLQLAVFWSAVLFVVISVIGYGIYTRFRWRSRMWELRPKRFTVFILILSILLGSATLFFNRPDGDDVGFFSQIRLDVLQADQPFQPRESFLPLSNQSEDIFRMFSYPAFWGVIGGVLGIEPLALYHNGGSFFGATLWVLVYAALYRELRLRKWETAGAVLIAILFLLIDGNLHLTHGNWAFFRMWQGKIVAFSVFLPLLLLMAIRFLRHPSWGRWLWMTFVAMILVDFTRSSIFLVPIFMAAVGLSYLVAYRGRRWRRVLWLGSASWYPLAFGLFILFTAFLPSLLEQRSVTIPESTTPSEPTLLTQTEEAYSVIWWENVYEETIGSPESLLRNAALLLLPFVLLGGAYRWWIGGISIWLILLTATPITGPILIEVVSNSAYWRIFYLLPLPLLAGLVVLVGRYRMIEPSYLPRPETVQKRNQATPPNAWVRWGAVVLVIGLTMIAFERAVPSPDNRVTVKAPGETRVNPRIWSFVQATENRYDDERVLALNQVAMVLSLTQLEDLEAIAYRHKPVKVRNHLSRLDRVLQCDESQWREEEVNDYLDEFQPTVIVMQVHPGCRQDGPEEYIARVFPGWEIVQQEDRFAILRQS